MLAADWLILSTAWTGPLQEFPCHVCRGRKMAAIVVPCPTVAAQTRWGNVPCIIWNNYIPSQQLLNVIEHHFVDAKVKEHLVLAITATCWGEALLSPQSYRNSVMEQQRSHKSAIDKARAAQNPLKVNRQLNLRTRYYSKVSLFCLLCIYH